jgi:integrase
MTQRVYDALYVAHIFDEDGGSPWVFTNPVMRAAYPDNPEKWRYVYRDKFLKTLCRRAGVPEFAFHALRHYAASAMAAAGVPTTAIQTILGHENASTTDNYLQDLGRADNALEALDEKEHEYGKTERE